MQVVRSRVGRVVDKILWGKILGWARRGGGRGRRPNR